MKTTKLLLVASLMLAGYSFIYAQSIREKKDILLNNKNYVYLIFDTNVSEVKFDCDPDDIQLEQLTPNSFGLRFNEGATVPVEGVGGMIVLAQNIFHPVWLYFSEKIPVTTINMSEKSTPEIRDTLINKLNTSSDIQQHCEAMFQLHRQIASLGEKNAKVELQLHNVGVSDKHLYLLFSLDNRSKVDYHVDYQGLHIRHKNVAADEMPELRFDYKQPTKVAAGEAVRYILVYDLFTLKNQQEMFYVVKETNGGRSFNLPIKNTYLYGNVHRLHFFQ